MGPRTGDWAEHAWPCSLTKSLETWLVSSSHRDRRARGNSWSSGERGAEEAALCRLPEHWEAGRTGLSNFYCHYCTLIPLQRICNRSCLACDCSHCTVRNPLAFPHFLQYSTGWDTAPGCWQPHFAAQLCPLQEQCVWEPQLSTFLWWMQGTIIWFKVRRKLFKTKIHFGACLSHCLRLAESSSPGCIRQKWTSANCLQQQVCILNLSRSIKQWLRNHSRIAPVIDEGKACTFPNHCFLTPTVKLNLYTPLVWTFWFLSIYWL